MIQAVKISSVKFAWKVLSQTLLWMETSLLLARITRHLPPTHQLVTPSIGSVCGAVQDTCNLECHRTALAWSHYDSKSQSLSILFGLFYRLLYSRVWCLYESRDFKNLNIFNFKWNKFIRCRHCLFSTNTKGVSENMRDLSFSIVSCELTAIFGAETTINQSVRWIYEVVCLPGLTSSSLVKLDKLSSVFFGLAAASGFFLEALACFFSETSMKGGKCKHKVKGPYCRRGR